MIKNWYPEFHCCRTSATEDERSGITVTMALLETIEKPTIWYWREDIEIMQYPESPRHNTWFSCSNVK